VVAVVVEQALLITVDPVVVAVTAQESPVVLDMVSQV
jgi:hypothetical protein